MSEKNKHQLCNSKLPSFLNSREGWGQLFEMKRPHYPHLHQIEPTNSCPYNCIMCPRGEKMHRPVSNMDMKIFTKVIDEVATYPDSVKLKPVELFHFGESLLHPQIADMNLYASSHGLYTVLSVNAIELTEEIAEKLIKGNAGKIIVSLDGFDAKSFLHIRRRSINYQKAIDNIAAAQAILNSRESKTELSVRMIAMNINSHKKEEFSNFWDDKGIKAEIRPFFPWGEENMVELGEFEKYPPFMPCPFLWQYVVVQWNGDVVACCRDYNAENLMGNVKNNTLEEIWNGSKYSQFRKEMIKGIYNNNICEPCMKLYSADG